MKASDIVKRLQDELPRRSSLFSETLSVTSLTRSGSTVTAVCASPHGLSTGDYAVISGAYEFNPIVALTFANGFALGETQNNHDLTEPPQIARSINDFYDFNYSDVTGATESEYNIRAVVASVSNRKLFSYPVEGSPATPATGSPALRQEGGYNGRFEVTVIDPNTFTYEITATPISPAGGTIMARVGIRITSAVSAERALRSYTEQTSKTKYWLFVVLGDVNVSKNRSILTDASTENSSQNEFRERLIEPFRLFVIVPGIDAYSAREFQDGMEDVRGDIYHSMAGYIFPSALAETPFSKTSPLGDRFSAEWSNDAIYVHEFSFERVVDVTYRDTIGPDANRAFRDISLTTGFNTGTETTEAEIDLDEQPLP